MLTPLEKKLHMLELKIMYPFLSKQEVEELLENMIEYWTFIINNSELIRTVEH